MGGGNFPLSLGLENLKGFWVQEGFALLIYGPGALLSHKRLHTHYSVGCVPTSPAGALTASNEEHVLFL